jgi:predicted enzyme related to lactoylglutathione lyase
MSQADNNLRMDYVEFPATDIPRTRQFYQRVFGWKFEDYGPDYTSFVDGRIAGGFSKERKGTTGAGPLVVLYAVDLERIQSTIQKEGGRIVKEIFSFPGGRRFHFTDPSGNELAVWSE